MSLAHFDDIYQICCGMEEEETLRKEKLANERLKLMKDLILDDFRWWEEAIRESLNEEEREVFYV
ncbi:hypothetical protein SAMN05444673_2259 [Bacillus sp. OV166]|uniref:hypothetical protein n=1 Tax=Bacillus sp. OV166 TaxID=1882763 RepID=UPI000A2AABC9|nr:hypothetical protein [Bacillus sp. OV166]SMQ72886.1 hypothetical protein SAMN05444673_2259 [Bacillus sp. OV166]